MDRYALVIGISHYEGMDDLSKPQGDAIALQKVLESAGWRVTCLSDRVTYEVLDQALQTFLERQTAGQDALIYFTGHGFMVEESEDERRGYLATADCTVEVAGPKIVAQRRGLSFSRLNGLIQRAQLSSLVVLLDCCHGGLFVEDGLVKQSFRAAPDQNFCWIAACRSFQQSYARKSQPHSLFTGALLQSLAQDQARGDVTVFSVLHDVNAAFKQMALQEPIYIGAGKDIPLISYQPPIAPPISAENPYQGLRAFTAATQQFFFGRETEIQTLAQKVQDCGFVPLIGASGSGKSSVVRAGLMPRLEALGWRVRSPIVPGTNPIAALRLATDGLDICDDDKILLVVDQFEEVFTLCRDRAEQSRFIQCLLEFSAQGRIAVVVTLRADFVEAGLADEGLKRAIETDAVWLGAMSVANLERAIEEPAIAQGATLQPKLLAQILQDVESEENCLPLLEFALTQLWEPKFDQTLTLDAYRQLGGVAGALNAHAEAVYKQLATQKREEWVQRVMLRLVRTGEGTKDTRQRQRRADLLAMAKDGVEREAVGAVLQTLVDGRLLVSDRVDQQDVIDLSHEALMLSWQRLVGWRESDRSVRRIVDKIEDEQWAWQNNRKQRRYLLDGRLLKDAQRLLKEAPANVVGTKAFIQQSLGWRRVQMASVLVLPLLVLGVPSEYVWREKEVSRNYGQIGQCHSPMECQTLILSLIGGCRGKWSFPGDFKDQTIHYLIEKVIGYPTERIVGNCRPLDKTDLRNSHLPGANLSNSFLHSVNLRNSTLHGAELRRVNFDNADLSSADLTGVNLSNSFLHGSNLKNAKLNNSNLANVNLDSANLGNADLTSVDLSNSFLHSSNLKNAKLNNSNLTNVNFDRANLSYAILQSAIVEKSFMHSANISNANLIGTDLSGVNLDNANLQGARFGCLPDGIRGREKCSNLKNIKWNEKTNWQGIQGWENVENIPSELKQQLRLSDAK